jgi:hypothetical protein
VPNLTETTIMLVVLGLIDVVMISNLLIMVIVGGYETFVSRLNLEGHPDQPEWLDHVNASVLKVKLATAIIGISRSTCSRPSSTPRTTARSAAVADRDPRGLPAVGTGHCIGRPDHAPARCSLPRCPRCPRGPLTATPPD